MQITNPAVRNTCLALLIVLSCSFAHCGDVANIDCSGQVDPVCAIDGTTYENECYATQNGQFTFVSGACPAIVCTQEHVCGIDGVSYLTNCFAVLSGVTVYLPGDCPICSCTDLVCEGAVCGDDNVTYPTNCFAQLVGVANYTPGECE